VLPKYRRNVWRL